MAATAPPVHVLTHDGSAHERLVRNVARLAGVGGLLFGVMLLPQIALFGEHVPWWTAVAVISVFGSAAAVVIATYRRSIAATRSAVTIYAASYLLIEISWLLLRHAGTVDPEPGFWLSAFPGVVCLATAAVWRPVPIICYLVTAVTLSHLIGVDNFADTSWPLRWILGTVYSALFTVAGIGVVRSGRVLDESAELARSQAGAAAAAEARAAERRRFDALTHDDVMATLLGASRSANSPALADQANSTVAQLDLLRSGQSQSTDLDPGALRALLLSASADVADDIPIEVTQTGDAAALEIPGEVGRAIGIAVTEAIRNTLRHAGADAACVVHAELGPDWVQVDVVDDGCGFDPRDVPPHRLGLRVSIARQFGKLPGASARIDSAPGSGTRITLTWRASR